MVGAAGHFIVIGGGRESLAFVSEVSSRGLVPVVFDGDKHCEAFQKGFRVEEVDIFDSDSAVRVSLDLKNNGTPIVGVSSFAVDCPVTTARVAEALSLPGIPANAAVVSSSKSKQKVVFETLGIPTPRFLEVNEGIELEVVQESLNFPVVIKPVDSRGSRGVFLCPALVDVAKHHQSALNESKTRTVVVEEFLPGPQFSSETVVIGGVATTVGVSTRNYSLNDYTYPEFLEDGGDLPAVEFRDFFVKFNEEVEKIAEFLGIRNGTIKGDLVVNNGKLYWLEFALRPGGGYFGSHEIPHAYGINFQSIVIDLALGNAIDKSRLAPTRSVPVCQRFIFAKHDADYKIVIPECVSQDPKTLELEIFSDGTHRRLGGGLAKVGMVICSSDSTEGAKGRAEETVKAIVEASSGLFATGG